MCVHLIQPSPDSCCRPNPCSTCSQMGRCSVSQEGGLGWSLCTCKRIQTHLTLFPCCAQSFNADIQMQVWYWAQDIHSPEKGVLQVQEIAGLWSCLIHLGNNTDVVALSVGKEIRFALIDKVNKSQTDTLLLLWWICAYFNFFLDANETQKARKFTNILTRGTNSHTSGLWHFFTLSRYVHMTLEKNWFIVLVWLKADF